MEVSELQADVGRWSREQFGIEQPALYPLLGVSEEYGELVHSVLKQLQGIRLDEEDVGEDAEIDAVGDIIVYLADFCERRGLDMEDCIEDAWGEVSQREWDSDVETNIKMDQSAEQVHDDALYVVDENGMGIKAGPFEEITSALREQKLLSQSVKFPDVELAVARGNQIE